MKNRPALWTLALAAAVVLAGCNKHDATNDAMQPGVDTTPATSSTPMTTSPDMMPSNNMPPASSSSAMMPPPTLPATSSTSGR